MVYTPYKRSDRVSREIYEVIADAVHNRLSDPRLDGVQITSCTMTDDLQLLKIHYFMEGDDQTMKRCLRGLNSARGFIKRVIGQQLNLRVIPEIRFYYDQGIANAEKIDGLLNELRESGGMGDEESENEE